MAKKEKTGGKNYKRIMLKISGEALAGDKSSGIDYETIHSIASEIKEVQKMGVQIGVVIGGGNIFRGGRGKIKIDRVVGDYMGMLATIINAIPCRTSWNRWASTQGS